MNDNAERAWWALHGPLHGNVLQQKPFVVLHTDGEAVTVIERRSSRLAAECIAENIGIAAWVEFDPEHSWSSGTTTA